MRRRSGWGFLTCLLGLVAFAGFNAFFRDFAVKPNAALQNLGLGIACAVLTVMCALKFSGIWESRQPAGRKYTPGDPLPVSMCPGLLLEPGEIGHLCETVQIGKVKSVSTGSVTTHSGGSVRVTRGFSMHGGSSYSRATRADVLDRSAGTLYVTNKRIVGASPKYSFSQTHSSLTSIQMYSDGFLLQFGSMNYRMLVRDPVYVATILQVANRLSIQG